MWLRAVLMVLFLLGGTGPVLAAACMSEAQFQAMKAQARPELTEVRRINDPAVVEAFMKGVIAKYGQPPRGADADMVLVFSDPESLTDMIALFTAGCWQQNGHFDRAALNAILEGAGQPPL